ncbi:MAG: adenosine kinase [Chlamydiales bacterium]
MGRVVGVGGPILDLILQVSDAYLESIPGKKGGMLPVSFPALESLITNSGQNPISLLGGCSRNTLHAMAELGDSVALIGQLGNDKRGADYQRILAEQGIEGRLLVSETPTAIVLSMVTPDGQRTMRTFQGASTELEGCHLKREMFRGAELVHLEGYTLYNHELTEHACLIAKEMGAKVSLDLSSFETVERFRPRLLSLLERYVDIVFANEDEARALTGEGESLACDRMAELTEVSVVLLGERGCLVGKGKQKFYHRVQPIVPVDTTGAGDLFASGFLHAYLQNAPLEVCAELGSMLGGAVIQEYGSIIPSHKFSEICRDLSWSSALHKGR